MNSIDINPSNNPSNKDVVLLLCTHIRDEEREISSKSGTKKVIYSVWKCPNHNCVTEGEIKFQKQSGFTNAFNHLMRCIGKGDAKSVYSTYHQNIPTIADYLQPHSQKKIVFTVSSRDRIVYDWLKLVIDASLPISVIENESFRSFSKHDKPIGRKFFRKVILALTEVVEEKLAKEMAAAGPLCILIKGTNESVEVDC